MTFRTALTTLICVLVTVCVQADEALMPRQPLPKDAQAPRPIDPRFEHQLVVKFHDHAKVRSAGPGRLVSLSGLDLTVLEASIAGRADFQPLIDLPAETLARLELEAAQRSGRAQPDLGGMLQVRAAKEDLADLADILHGSDLVEFVAFEALFVPPPGWFGGPDACFDIAPVTPNYFSRQGYHNGPAGLGMAAAWAHPGGRGQGIRIADVEYGYRDGHEDLCNIIPEPGQTMHPSVISFGWHEHGTAVFGEMIGGENGYGVTGLTPDAQGMFYFEWTLTGQRRVAAVTAAIAAVDAGDVVLLEMQTTGAGGGFGPAELNQSIWLVTRLGVDRGVVVVAAAGNGDQNLDSGAYATYRAWGDSGAIIVGAGSSDGSRSKLGFSTYGSRVNVHGWGQNVFTAGYGDFVSIGGDPNQSYTATFSGTSSASPFVASAAASLLGIHKAATGRAMEPSALRQLLIDTGKPQGSGGNIGPFPDMAAAVDALLASLCRVDMDGDGQLTLFDFLAFQSAFASGSLAADFDGDGMLTVFDFLVFQNEFMAGC